MLLYLLQRLQPVLPLRFGRAAMPAVVAFNTAISFVTNTNWQSYVPETTHGPLRADWLGLTVQNFVSAAVGMAVAIALIRGFVRARTDRLGNFWVDLVRGTHPDPAADRVRLRDRADRARRGGQPARRRRRHQPGRRAAHASRWPRPASQEAIKELGTNGGGIFNANSAHPFENPNGWTNLIEIFLILVIPVRLTRTFGVMVGNKKQGYVAAGVMAVAVGRRCSR